jgi:predicted ester cyclase
MKQIGMIVIALAVGGISPAIASTDANKQTAMEVFRALETGDVALLNKAFADNGTNHVGGESRPRNGPHQKFVEAAPFVGALSNRKVDTFEILADGDLVSVRSRLCGDHTEAPLLGVEPSGRRICGHYQNIYRFKDGKIIDNYVANDARAIEQQIRGEAK